MAIKNNQKDREWANFQQHPSRPKNTERFVADETAHTKLDAINAALGGSNDTTATMFNVSMPVSGTEYSQALPANCKKFIIRSRSKGKIQLAYTTGESGTKYITINPGATFEDNNLYVSQTIYFQSSKNTDILELLAFS